MIMTSNSRFLMVMFLALALSSSAWKRMFSPIARGSSSQFSPDGSAPVFAAIPPRQNAVLHHAAAVFVAVAVSCSTALPASAMWPFSASEQEKIDKLSSYQRPVAELLDELRPVETPNAIGVYAKTQLLRGGAEDAAVVINYLETYLKPLQQVMADVAPKLELSAGSQERANVLPSLMKGHLLELQQAIANDKVDEEAKEVEEVQETLAEFLKLASSKYNVQPFVAPAALSEKDLFGPLSCEYWGKTRVPGSNQCQ